MSAVVEELAEKGSGGGESDGEEEGEGDMTRSSAVEVGAVAASCPLA
jgi:hypothetical protein